MESYVINITDRPGQWIRTDFCLHVQSEGWRTSSRESKKIEKFSYFNMRPRYETIFRYRFSQLSKLFEI